MTSRIADLFVGPTLFFVGIVVGTFHPVTSLAPLQGTGAGDATWITATLAAVAANAWVLGRLHVRHSTRAAE